MAPGPELEDVYDEATVARLARTKRRPTHTSEAAPTGWRRGATAGALVTALALGLQEVFAAEPDEAVIEEIDLDSLMPPNQPVTVMLIDGAPRASRVIVRPSLLPV